MNSCNILLTGVTGFLGGQAAVHLLLRHPDCRLILLVRAESRGAAAQRVQHSLLRFADAAVIESTLWRCTIILGDLTESGILDDSRIDQVTHVLHLAANTSFRSVRSVRHTNILGTLALAHRMQRVRGLRRFLYVGTAYICGANPPWIVHEDDNPRVNVRHLVEYTASKAECEMLLERTAPDLPLVIARPSVVVGHTQLGCLPSASIFWYYRTLDLLRRVPASLTTRKDIIPVDYTAASLVLLLLKSDLRYRRYHISAGAGASVTWQEIAEAFAAADSRRSPEPYRVVDEAVIQQERHRLRERLGPGDEERLMQALELYLRFSTSGVEVFDNQRLLEEGMPPPPRFTSYLGACTTLGGDRSIYEQMLDDF